jgi:transposase InsO family protein
MRTAELRRCKRGKKRRTIRRGLRAAPAPDLLRRDFVADQPNKVWQAVIIYRFRLTGACACIGFADMKLVTYHDDC